IDVERLAEERAVVDREREAAGAGENGVFSMDEDTEREAAGAGENGVFSMDEDTEVLGGTPGILLPGPSAPLSENALAAEKLEGMLSLSLTFLSGVFTESGAGGAGGQGRMEAEGREAFFNALVDVFCSKVLTTFRPKYTQFVMFVVCSSSERLAKRFLERLITITRLAKRFLERLITITVETQHADTERHAACSYFGSFLARARYLRLPTIRTSLSLLARWVHDYLERYDANVTAPDPATHCLFYSVVQALLYALCFRALLYALCFRVPSLAADAKHAKRDVFLDLRLQHIVLSNLNPLKAMKQTAVAQFHLER
ncbi:RNA polymerase I-specific transcription initiation factor RRN3, partial [Baffinella frigidus]